MSIYLNGNKAKNLYLNGAKCNSIYLGGQKIYSSEPETFIATCTSMNIVNIYKNLNGVQGALVETINLNNDYSTGYQKWQYFAETYVPRIKYITNALNFEGDFNNPAYNDIWNSPVVTQNLLDAVAIPVFLNFDSLETMLITGAVPREYISFNYAVFQGISFPNFAPTIIRTITFSMYMFSFDIEIGAKISTQYVFSFLDYGPIGNRTINFPNLTEIRSNTGNPIIKGTLINFNYPEYIGIDVVTSTLTINFPKLVSFEGLFYFTAAKNNLLSPNYNIIFGELVLTTDLSDSFLKNAIKETTLTFETVQTITAFGTNAFLNSSNNINLRLPAGSAAVNVANKTWCGKTFKSITLI